MKYKDSIQILKNAVKMINDPMYMANKSGKNYISNFSKILGENNNMNNNVFAEPEDSNIEYNKDISSNDINQNKDSESYEDNKLCDKKNAGYYNEVQETSSSPQGVIDSIANELTSVRLQQAIILSEIVGKPRSKTRKRRRF